jgi:hypothetical protein
VSEVSTELSPLQQLATEGTPFQRLLGQTLIEVGGLDFMAEWAEDHPEQFMRVVMAAHPAAVTGGGGGGATLNITLPPGCGPGPLDNVVSDQ